jgi:hypothetical protein
MNGPQSSPLAARFADVATASEAPSKRGFHSVPRLPRQVTAFGDAVSSVANRIECPSAGAVLKWLKSLFSWRQDPADNYSPRAQKLLKLARKEADRRRHTYVGTDHLLLGLLAQREGVGFSALQALGFDLEKLRAAIEASSPEGGATTMEPFLPLTPRARHVLKVARTEALKLGHEHVGTEHLLLGLLQERTGLAPLALKERSIDVQKVRLTIAQILSPSPTPASGNPARNP